MGIVQFLAGMGYLAQKVLLFFAIGKEPVLGRHLRIAAWVSYLFVGLPMWMIIFYIEKNWILMFVEGGGFPSMLLGLVLSILGKETKSKWAKWLNLFAYAMTFMGIGMSFAHFGIFVSIRQALEFSVSLGFLVGTLLLAKQNPKGWLWYVLMNASAGALMWVQHYPFLTFQQAVSITFVILAYRKARRTTKK